MAAGLRADVRRWMLAEWRVWARRKQLPPPGVWFTWLLLAGRGFGKTRTGTHWIHERAMAGDERREMMLISKTPADVRDDMIEGPGGILRNVHACERPEYLPSVRRLVWPTGATARLRSGADPDGVRGFSGDTAWCDELAAWKYPRETWDNLMLGLREARIEEPQVLVTTTPKPIAVLREIAAKPGTVVVHGTTHENRANLSERFFQEVIAPLLGTTKGQQEIEARLLDEDPAALWSRQLIEAGRRRSATDLERIVIGVDPTTAGEARAREGKTDACGIIAAGVDARAKRHGYVLGDHTLRGGPERWGRAVVAAYGRYRANLVVAEGNQGGALVRQVIQGIDPSVPVKIVHASMGRAARAEPVVSLYEQWRVHHVRQYEGERVDLAAVEDELVTWVPGEGHSPNRLDALVWALTELMVRGGRRAQVTTF